MTVLEARDRVGGRVHSYSGGGLGVPADLGASIVTGIEPDVGKGLRPDPSAVLFRQLGIQLNVLGKELPLFVGARPLDPKLDARIEGCAEEGPPLRPARAGQPAQPAASRKGERRPGGLWRDPLPAAPRRAASPEPPPSPPSHHHAGCRTGSWTTWRPGWRPCPRKKARR